MRREITFSFSTETLIEKLDLPEDSVILSVFTQTINCNPRQFCFKISVPDDKLSQYFEKIQKQKKKQEGRMYRGSFQK